MCSSELSLSVGGSASAGEAETHAEPAAAAFTARRPPGLLPLLRTAEPRVDVSATRALFGRAGIRGTTRGTVRAGERGRCAAVAAGRTAAFVAMAAIDIPD